MTSEGQWVRFDRANFITWRKWPFPWCGIENLQLKCWLSARIYLDKSISFAQAINMISPLHLRKTTKELTELANTQRAITATSIANYMLLFFSFDFANRWKLTDRASKTSSQFWVFSSFSHIVAHNSQCAFNRMHWIEHRNKNFKRMDQSIE